MMTALKRKQELRQIDDNFDGRISMLEYLLYQYKEFGECLLWHPCLFVSIVAFGRVEPPRTRLCTGFRSTCLRSHELVCCRFQKYYSNDTILGAEPVFNVSGRNLVSVLFWFLRGFDSSHHLVSICFLFLTTKCGWEGTYAPRHPHSVNFFLLWAFWLIFFEPAGNLLFIQGKLLRISNLLFRLKYFPKTPFLPYRHLLWAL